MADAVACGGLVVPTGSMLAAAAPELGTVPRPVRATLVSVETWLEEDVLDEDVPDKAAPNKHDN